jgi:hypothetical protein
VWFKWTAPATWTTDCGPTVTIDTFDSTVPPPRSADFDTLLSVYNTNRVRHTGDPGALVIENDDDPFGVPGARYSSVTFNPVGGATYWLQVDGFQGADGDIVIQAHQ